jgi:hypothetical protein
MWKSYDPGRRSGGEIWSENCFLESGKQPDIRLAIHWPMGCK